MDKLYCRVCREYVDKVILSYSVRTWDELKQDYVHRGDDGYDEGDWACSKCGTSVMETGFRPPSDISRFLRPGSEVAMSSSPPPRSFPDTYSDWVNLAADIKEKSPDIGTMAQANTALTAISENQPSAEEAKRWLARKARELGIR